MKEPLHKYPDGLACINHYFLCNFKDASYYLSLIHNGAIDSFVIDRIVNEIADSNENDYVDIPLHQIEEEYMNHKDGYDKAYEIAKKYLSLR